ncbi:hypothetical protein [Deinococcus alpinitundrae]|uniref:hypothetical protein n=1 Tax=Deinococcus alpinitundrae TaxID=468913 RepID=UPI0013798C35|nr:hypothetical protein [Deinococcus alpinitundrae]
MTSRLAFNLGAALILAGLALLLTLDALTGFRLALTGAAGVGLVCGGVVLLNATESALEVHP